MLRTESPEREEACKGKGRVVPGRTSQVAYAADAKHRDYRARARATRAIEDATSS